MSSPNGAVWSHAVTIGALALFAVAASGCDEKSTAASSESPKSQIPDEKEIDEEVSKGVDDVLKKRGPKWKVDYEGELSGAVEGGIMSVVSVSKNTTVAGAAMTEDRKGKAPQSFRAMIMRYGEEPQVDMKLTLADGTKCSASAEDRQAAKIDITDGDKKTFAAKITGQLSCGDAKDKSIKFTAKLDKDP